jgi:ribosome-associated protein
MLRITNALSLADDEIEERFVRAPGPGGQNVDKVATSVELRFDISRSSLPDDVKHRLIRAGGSRVSREGVLVIESREFRSQARNREAARARLAALIRRALTPPKVRRPTAPTSASRQRRLEAKKQRGAIKRLRRTIDE